MAAAAGGMFAPSTFVAPAPGQVGKGCYLVFDVASEGTLFLHWSETPVPGAVAYLNPQAAVPKFKYTSGGGRSELIRGFRGETKKRLFEGFCSFFKLARDTGMSPVCLLTTEVVCYLRMQDGSVVALRPGVATPIAAAAAVVAVPHGCDAFEGAKTMAQDYFLGTGLREGASWSLL